MSPSDVAPVHPDMRIDGADVRTAERIEVRSPADVAAVVGSVPRGGTDHVRNAATAATSAFPAWSRVPIRERADLLRAAADALSAGSAGRGLLLARESGHLISDAEAGMERLGSILRYYADVGQEFEDARSLPSSNGSVVVVRQPMGVVALIVPWNGPTALGFLGLAPILLAGNTVVIKPPTEAPLAFMDALRVVEPLFPRGTINVVTGYGADIGDALVTDPRVRKIHFTGSIAVGRRILRAAADTVKRVTMELGGNDAAVVMADADLDHAAPELVSGAFGLTGQVCYNVKRIYVDRMIAAEFTERFRAHTDAYVVGDNLDRRATLGPVISERQQAWVRSLVDDARQQGATVDEVGRALPETAWDAGHYLLPTVVSGIDNSCRLVQEEQFGPAIPIIVFDDLDEALEQVNATEFGLSSSLWTRDEDRAFLLARRIEAGTTFINVHRRGASGVDMPFGGFKQSGIGRSHGVVALEEQFELHTISSRRPPPLG